LKFAFNLYSWSPSAIPEEYLGISILEWRRREGFPWVDVEHILITYSDFLCSLISFCYLKLHEDSLLLFFLKHTISNQF
jgi:hypothetical protein